jgi:hypothetical protein
MHRRSVPHITTVLGEIIDLTGSDSEEEHAPEQEETMQRRRIWLGWRRTWRSRW